MELTCAKCSKSFEDNIKVNFCPFCLNPIKCIICHEHLIKDAIGCSSCGTPIKKTDSILPLNEIEYEQKGDSKKFKATFTDTVGHDLVSTFGGMIGIQLPKRKSALMPFIKTNDGERLNIGADDSALLEDDDILEALNRVFKVDGEKIILQTANFKAKTKLDKAIRVSLLTLLGYKYLHKLEEIKMATLTYMLNRAKLNFGAFRSWINGSEEIGQKGGGYIFLTTNGIPTAIAVLNEIINPDIIEGSIVFNTSKRSGRRKKSEVDESSDSLKKSSKSPKEYLEKLIEEAFFSEKKSLSEIVKHLKDNHAVTFKTSDISGHMGKLIGDKKLKREKNPSTKIYEYFI